MTIDREKLKALAEAARDYSGSDLIEHESRYNALAYEVDPAAVLALLAEIEEDAMHMRAFGEVIRSQAEQIEQLKAENEALRREREGKVLCDLDLFETLRDSANTEADEHRQCMATYRPLRQEHLDAVVKECDDLIAAVAKEAAHD